MEKALIIEDLEFDVLPGGAGEAVVNKWVVRGVVIIVTEFLE